MQTKLEKRVYYLQIYCAAITLLLGSLFVFGFTSQPKQKFGEIDVERINVVEKDGKLDMVISNKERQHPGMVDDKPFDRKRDVAGILFFNEKGNECGGLIFTNNGNSGGESLTFDKFRGDQTIALQHNENKEGYWAALTFNDENITLPERLAKIDEIKKLPDEAAQKAAYEKMRDNGDLLVPRLSIGKGRDKSAFFQMSDAKGKARIKMSVAADGNSKLDFLDETGKVVYSLPERVAEKNKSITQNCF